MKITINGLDIEKIVLHLFAVNKIDRLVKKKQLKRNQVLSFIVNLEPCLIAVEACGKAYSLAVIETGISEYLLTTVNLTGRCNTSITVNNREKDRFRIGFHGLIWQIGLLYFLYSRWATPSQLHKTLKV